MAVAREGIRTMNEEKRSSDILVVDDEPEVARIIAINLEYDGHQVRVAYNGQEALEEVARKEPDCILLDIMMPVMDGWEVLRALKRDPGWARIPVIVVTARHTDIDRIKGFSGGAIEYVTKPFDPESLKDYVAKALQPRQREVEEETRRNRIRALQTSTLYRIAEALISTLEIQEILEIVAEQLLSLFDIDICAISLLNPSGSELRRVSSRSTFPLGRKVLDTFDVSLSRLRGALGADPLDLSGPAEISTSGKDNGGTEAAGRLSIQLLPLKAKGRFTGAIFLGQEKRLWFSEEEKELLSAIGNLVAMAIENARLYDDLRYDEEVHKQLLQMVITAQEDERRRVASELHDGVIQNMVSALFRLQLCATQMGETPDGVRQALEEAQEIVNGGIAEMRRIIAGLRPLALDDMGLVIAIQRYIRYLQEEAPFPIVLTADDEVPTLTPDVETALYRIFQEGMNNIFKHSQCGRADVSIHVREDEFVLEIKDDGIGFELPAIQHRLTQGFGLVGMRERAESLGGILEVRSSNGEGTMITARIPLRKI
jgi:signal transduction histidine kinase/CheY-like chemotaxis protein